MIREGLAKCWFSWERFWFAAPNYQRLGLFRAVFSSILFVMYAFRQMHLEEYMSSSGLVTPQQALNFLDNYYRPWLSWFPENSSLLQIFHILFLFVLLLLALGVWARWTALLGLILHLCFLQRNFSIAYGADNIATLWLFGLALTDSGERFSLGSRFKAAHRELNWFRQSLSGMGVRFIQIQLCIVYAYTGFEKLKGPVWWDGTALWTALSNQQVALIDMRFLGAFPVLLAVLTYITVIFEIYFAVLVWLKCIRLPILLVGAFFHIGIALTMGLFFFSLEMVAAYILFFDISEYRNCRASKQS